MPNYEATRCRHIKVNGTQCGSPALRNKTFCFYHQEKRPWNVECYSDIPEATGEITLPYFEDAHSVQSVIRQVMQMVLQKRIEQKTASILLYALQIASSNLKRMELEKPQPEQVVTDIENTKYDTIAALRETDGELPVGTIHVGTIDACAEFGVRDEESVKLLTAWVPTLAHKKRAQGWGSLFLADTGRKQVLPPRLRVGVRMTKLI